MKSIKLLLAIIGLVASVFCEAQINYQAVVRDADNVPQVNQMIDIDVTITQDGTTIYSEQHSSVPTGELGIVNLAIGSIDPVGFDELDWSLDNYEVQMSIDGILLPSTPIRSVPIAEYAKNSRWNWISSDSSLTYSSGKVGIGLDEPLYPLHIRGSVMQFDGIEDGDIHLNLGDTAEFNSQIKFQINSETKSSLSYFHDDEFLQMWANPSGSNSSRVVLRNGNVGINTTQPSDPLHVVGLLRIAGGSSHQKLRFYSSNSTQDNRITSNDQNGNQMWMMIMGDRDQGNRFVLDGVAGDGVTDFTIEDHKTSVQCLQINGGCDITEPFESSVEFIEPGTVVSMTESGIVPSSSEYDNRVVGVVSGANGIQKGMSLSQTELFDNGIDIAIAGRVYVKTTGEVKIGDQLVSSEISGVAKAEKDFSKFIGRSIGKAISSPDENGYVLMIVNLQ